MSFIPTKTPLEDIVIGIESGIKKMIDIQNQDLTRKECIQLMVRNQSVIQTTQIKCKHLFNIIKDL